MEFVQISPTLFGVVGVLLPRTVSMFFAEGVKIFQSTPVVWILVFLTVSIVLLRFIHSDCDVGAPITLRLRTVMIDFLKSY